MSALPVFDPDLFELYLVGQTGIVANFQYANMLTQPLIICLRRSLLLASAASVLSSCTSVGRLDSNVVAPSNSEAVFVLGVAPENYRISVFPGSVDGGTFQKSSFRGPAFHGAAKEGYVVGKVSVGDTVGITNVRVVNSSSAILGADFVPCGEGKTVVFQVPRAGVYYLVDLDYKFGGNGIEIRYGENLDAASAYIDTTFPALKGKLQQASYQFLPMSSHCGGVSYMQIPIYLPK